MALLADEQGRVLGTNKADSSNYQLVGLETAVRNIKEASAPLLAGVESQGERPLFVLGLAGVDRSNDKKKIEDMVAKHFKPDTRLIVVSDAYIALIGAVGGTYGIAVNAGTGAIAIGFNKEGRFARADGWGYILGDEGSGYWIGTEAIKAALRAYDGREGTTLLQKFVKTYFSVKELPELIEITYQKKLFPHQVARIAPLVFTAAEAGDKIAYRILEEAGYKLGLSTKAVIQRLKMKKERFKLALAGGVFRNEYLDPLLQSFQEVIRKISPQCQLIPPRFPPEVGAILLGLYQHYEKVPEQVFQNLADYRKESENLEVNDRSY